MSVCDSITDVKISVSVLPRKQRGSSGHVDDTWMSSVFCVAKFDFESRYFLFFSSSMYHSNWMAFFFFFS